MATKSVRMPTHVAAVLADLARRARVSEAEIARWSILTFADAVNRTEYEVGFLKLFRESEKVHTT